MTSLLTMKTYVIQPPECLEYDARAAGVARRVEAAIISLMPEVKVEHIGSTAVPGCAGKGIVDLMLLYPQGQLGAAKKALSTLGFQRQTVGHLFPETRPMRVGAVEHRGRMFRVHVHVIAASSPEAVALSRFRDRLRTDPHLRAAYVAQKQEIVAAGVTDCLAYTNMKGDFVRQTLSAADPASAPPRTPD